MTREESNARRICCPLCDKKKCEREANDCDVKKYLENRKGGEIRISEYEPIEAEGYDDGYYWDMRFCFELDGKRYIFTDIGSYSGYIPCSGEIMEVKSDENLDILLKDWPAEGIKGPDKLTEEAAIQYVKQLKESGTKPGESFELWNDEDE